MCETCKFCIADCGELNPEFGDGLGNDNVVSCAVYLPKGNIHTPFPNYIRQGEIVRREDHEWVNKQD